MDNKTKGAWLLAQSKSLDAYQGAGRLENIQYAGRTGRLYNLLRRNLQGRTDSTVNQNDIVTICQLNGIDRATRESALKTLQLQGRIDISESGAISVLGATSTAVLEATAEIFDACDPTPDEHAAIELSERISENPASRIEIAEFISDTFQLSKSETSGLIDVCRDTAILDQIEDRGHFLLFNNNTFRDGHYAKKAYLLMQSLSATDAQNLKQLQEMLARKGALLDEDAKSVLGTDLYSRVVGVGLFDRLEVSNNSEAVGYLASPVSFQKYGRPFEEDPVDDAKALLASLTYGITRSSSSRGRIQLPTILLDKLIAGDEVGGQYGATAIGEDYRELEKRQVIQVSTLPNRRYRMKLLKKDVGELARSIVAGKMGAAEAVLMDGSPAKTFQGPAETRKKIRDKHTVIDTRHVMSALDRLRSGG
ncbi:hypothetical protein [Variovorax sp.]|uniref:hypothetical protein n=1 Tax=Variovorax sp. TaxID=1871043 RepID=UPI0025D4DE40|nr:hypothetical protein [Variovorax sp.]